MSSRDEETGYWRVLGPIWSTVSIYYSPAVFAAGFARLTPKQAHLLAAHWCYSEVCNGGLHQFFTNPTGVLAPEAVAGFRALGLPGCAVVVEEAIDFFGPTYPREQVDRCEVL